MGAILLLLLLIFVPLIVFATNEDLQIVLDEETGNHLIYVQGVEEGAKYALSEQKNQAIEKLDFINLVTDEDGNQVVLISKAKNEELKGKDMYIWIKNANGEIIANSVQLDFSFAFSKEKMNLVENTTKRILVDTTKTLTTVEDRDGVKTTVTTGAIEITDNKEATYFYQTIKLPAEDKYNRLMELLGRINQEYDEMDMYTKIQVSNEFYQLYDEIVTSADWKEVEDRIIAQPEDSKNGEQYLVLLKKAEEKNTTFDIQLLTCYENYTPEFEKQERQISETTKLPITYDSIALIVILAVILIALVIVFIKMKQANKKEDK